MRILFFSRGFSPHERRFLEKMAGWRHEISFLMLENPGEFRPEERLPDGIAFAGSLGFTGGVIPRDEQPGLVARFQEVCDRARPDLVHAGPIQSCGFLSALAGFHPLLLMSWGSDILRDADTDDLSRRVTRYALRASDWLFCDCVAVRNRVKEFTPYEDARMVMFPWGVDLRRFRPSPRPSSLRRDLGWEDRTVLLSTRMWEPVYGINTLLEAFQIASAKHPDLRLILLGKGSLGSRVGGFIREHDLDDRVAMPGMVDEPEMPAYFHASDLYISCSLSDGTSVSLLQAMACGLPVVVTDIPGNREWVTEGENGLLARGGDPRAYARAISRTLEIPAAEGKGIARMNRRIVEERADWDKNILLLLATYDRIEEVYGP
ncbi:MAG: glycosyltransferase family 4 protein [Methanomicrobiales archaeon]